MLKPVNGHLLIQPITHEGFIATQRETYEEIGVVLDADMLGAPLHPEIIGMRVYFDSWLAAKYPVEGETDKFYWLVKWEDVRAIENVTKE